MKYFIKIISLIGLFTISQFAYSASVTDTFATGDTLTADTLNNLKSAVNDNNTRIAAMERGTDIAVDCSADSSALKNTTLIPGNTYVLTGMCDGPIYISKPAGRYHFRGDAIGIKDDGIISPPGETEYYVLGFYGPVSARLENLRISAENYTTKADGFFTAAIYVEGNASVSLYDVDVVGGESGITSDSAYVFLGAGNTVTEFRQGGLNAGNNGTILVGQAVTVTGATGEPGDYSEALSAYRNGVIKISRGGSFTGGTDDGSNAGFDRFSITAVDNGSIRINNSGTVTLTGAIGAYRSSSIRIQTGTVSGYIESADSSHVRLENITHSGGIIDVYRNSSMRANDSVLVNGSNERISVGDLSILRLGGGNVGNAGTGSINLYAYGVLRVTGATDLGGRDINCSDPREFPGTLGVDYVNVGTTCP